MFEKIKIFFSEVKAELRKVSWPGREEVKTNTSVVLATIGMVGAFLWLVDMALQGIISQLMK
ncbi:MAG: preprotein translocase subunit SecE [Candidatus Schekmanbacteria bacterium]|nr:preprotein translocase subunit SecE [Candidatus Schekmanbacteria bacterium]